MWFRAVIERTLKGRKSRGLPDFFNLRRASSPVLLLSAIFLGDFGDRLGFKISSPPAEPDVGPGHGSLGNLLSPPAPYGERHWQAPS